MNETRKFKPGDKVKIIENDDSRLYVEHLVPNFGKVLTVHGYTCGGFVEIEEIFRLAGGSKYHSGWFEHMFKLVEGQQWAKIVTPVCKCNTRDLMAYGCPSAKGKQCRSESTQCA